MLLTLVCTALFAAAGLLAVGTILATLRRHAAQALAVVHASRAVADMREFRVVMTSQAVGASAPAWPQLRRQPRRTGFRGALLRPGESRRAAA